MFRTVARLSRIAAETSVSLLFIRTTSAASIATSVPAPIAIPMSARVSAGASLMPSPTMATLPRFRSFRITRSFPSGRTPAITSSTPACAPIAWAVRSLSPVSMTTCSPMFWSSRIACPLSSLIVSATAISPMYSPFRQKYSAVFPSSASRSAADSAVCGTFALVRMKLRLPPARLCSPRVPKSPFPGAAAKSVTSPAASPFASASLATARARGCSLFASRSKAACRSSCSPMPSAGRISVTFGSPRVIVPVLSRATTWMRPASSRDSAVLNKIPFFAPIPFPTMIATGVASPSAQGQLITRTEMPLAKA